MRIPVIRQLVLIMLGLTGTTSTGIAQNTQEQPLNRVVMEAYAQMLAENPRDYEVYLRRANEYYRNNDYTRALADINKAIEYTPASDKDIMFQELVLRAGIYEMGHRYSNALSDLNTALTLNPTSYQTICQRANVELELGLYRDARQDYTRLQRYNPRSTEALFGLAHVAVKEQNIGLANEYMTQAVALSSSDPDAYIQRAKVKACLNDYNGAATDLLQAFAMDGGSNGKALNELVKLAESNYSAVISALTDAIQQVPDGGAYYYIRANIAASHFHYHTAIDDLNHILQAHLYDYAGIYASLAECHYALCEFDKALDNIEYAIANYPDANRHKAYHVTRSKIYRAMHEYDKALLSVDTAIAKDPQFNDALTEKAMVLAATDKPAEATALLGEVSVNTPDKPYPYMLRAWIMNDCLNQPTGASSCYERLTDNVMDASNVRSLYGFALMFNGKMQEAAQWMDRCLETPAQDGLTHYYATCFYSWANQPDKAFNYMEAALQRGYANKYDWTINNDARINVSPIRNEARFQELLQRYSESF